jgi:asparagine synthase (glutamine-hydrolysing)
VTSSISGIWHTDERPLCASVLHASADRLQHRGVSRRSWISKSAGLIAGFTETQACYREEPLVSAHGVVVGFDGRLDNRADLMSLPSAVKVDNSSPDSLFILSAYLAYGPDFLERITGDFALAIFDTNRQQLLLARDPVGVRPLYYCARPGVFAFASEVKALGLDNLQFRPNATQVAEYVFGVTSEADDGATLFEGILSVLPSHSITVTHNGYTSRRYWDFDPTASDHSMSEGECCENFRHLFSQAVQRRLRSSGPVAVSISGGLDSSSVFCTAQQLVQSNTSPPMFGVSYAPEHWAPADETPFLAAIERAYGVSIERAAPPEPGFMHAAGEEVWHQELPFLDQLWNSFDACLSRAREMGAQLLITGHWGDQVLFNEGYLFELVSQGHWGKIRRHFGELGRWLPEDEVRILRRSFYRKLLKHSLPTPFYALAQKIRRTVASRRRASWYGEALLKAMPETATAAPAGGRRLPSHRSYVYDELRSKRTRMVLERLNKVVAMRGMDVAFPFLDRDLVSFLISIPGEILVSEGVPKAILRKAMRGILPDAVANRSWQADYSGFALEGLRRDFSAATAVLKHQSLAASLQFINADRVNAELQRNGTAVASEFLYEMPALTALELWLRAFSARDRGTVQ